MIIRRAFYREAALAILAVASVLLVLFVFLGLTQLLGSAVAGKHGRDIVLTLLGLELVNRLNVLLPLAVYLGIVLTIGRWYRDSEMTVLAACGVGLWSLSRAVLQLALIGAVLVAVLSLFLSPWARAALERVKSDSESRAELSVAVPGTFTELRGAGRILYVEGVTDAGVLTGVFASDRGSFKQNFLVAARGEQAIASGGELMLVLKEGSLYEGLPGQSDYRVVNFGTYRIRLRPPEAQAPSADADTQPTAMLLGAGDPRRAAELHWRLAKPVSVLVLAAFALLLAHTDARRGRTGNLVAAVLVYYLYSNLLGVGQMLLKHGSLPPALGLWWIHGLFAASACYLLSRRAGNRPLVPLPTFATRWRS